MKRENDRRSKFRFAIEREVRYKQVENGLVVASGVGHTANIGSGGVALISEKPLTPGALVELSISWPVLLDETCLMRFIVFGRVLRCTGNKAVCSVDKYEFRTQSRSIHAVPVARTDSMLHRWAVGMRKETVKTSMAGA